MFKNKIFIQGIRSLARPYFNQPGGGFQFLSHPLPGTTGIPTVRQLENAGLIIRINF